MIKKMNLFDAFRAAMMRDTSASRKEAFGSFMEIIKSNPAYLEALSSEYFHRMEAQWKLNQDSKTGSHSLVATPSHQQRIERYIERRSENAARVDKVHTDLKTRLRSVILLDLTLPCGKKLRDATGADCARGSGFLSEIARHIKPVEVVGKHLSEADVQNIQRRYEGRKAA